MLTDFKINYLSELLNQIILGDSLKELEKIDKNSIHLIISDIPYGIGADEWDVLHDNTNSAYLGSSPAQERAGAVFKKRGKPLNGWSEADKDIPIQYYRWCKSWADDWLRVLKPGGSAIVFAGRRLAHRCISALEDSGFIYKDMICWIKEKAPHRAQRLSVVYEKRNDNYSADKWNGWRIGNLRPIFEPILWFMKPYKLGGTIADNFLEHHVGAFNETAFLKYTVSPDNFISIGSSRDDVGLHPTQKPLKLMQALIELTTIEDQIVLDPFCGSGTSLAAALLLNRMFIGIDNKKEYVDIAQERLQKLRNNLENNLFSD
ncbi:MAG: site-specific DNA-methyltransferase [Brevinematales bacterium]|nr:site-specific DNA-methyltransferase [Brevinematales bacterium]